MGRGGEARDHSGRGVYTIDPFWGLPVSRRGSKWKLMSRNGGLDRGERVVEAGTLTGGDAAAEMEGEQRCKSE